MITVLNMSPWVADVEGVITGKILPLKMIDLFIICLPILEL